MSTPYPLLTHADLTESQIEEIGVPGIVQILNENVRKTHKEARMVITNASKKLSTLLQSKPWLKDVHEFVKLQAQVTNCSRLYEAFYEQTIRSISRRSDMPNKSAAAQSDTNYKHKRSRELAKVTERKLEEISEGESKGTNKRKRRTKAEMQELRAKGLAPPLIKKNKFEDTEAPVNTIQNKSGSIAQARQTERPATKKTTAKAGIAANADMATTKDDLNAPDVQIESEIEASSSESSAAIPEVIEAGAREAKHGGTHDIDNMQDHAKTFASEGSTSSVSSTSSDTSDSGESTDSDDSIDSIFASESDSQDESVPEITLRAPSASMSSELTEESGPHVSFPISVQQAGSRKTKVQSSADLTSPSVEQKANVNDSETTTDGEDSSGEGPVSATQVRQVGKQITAPVATQTPIHELDEEEDEIVSTKSIEPVPGAKSSPGGSIGKKAVSESQVTTERPKTRRLGTSVPARVLKSRSVQAENFPAPAGKEIVKLLVHPSSSQGTVLTQPSPTPVARRTRSRSPVKQLTRDAETQLTPSQRRQNTKAKKAQEIARKMALLPPPVIT